MDYDDEALWQEHFAAALENLERMAAKLQVRHMTGEITEYELHNDPEYIAADEALWDEQFARSQDVLEMMAQEVLAEYKAGLTEEFDCDDDLDDLG